MLARIPDTETADLCRRSFFFFSSRRRHTRSDRDWSSDVCSSDLILTQLRAEGYEVAPTYEAADLVVVNTCGFIDAAVDESLDAIGEALEHNGRVIVTGCLGARPERILERHPRVLKVTGPHAYEDVVGAVDEHLPPRHEPFLALLPPEGGRLTPRHHAYLKIAEGCNNKCSFCIIPSMRGRLASRRIDEVLREAE